MWSKLLRSRLPKTSRSSSSTKYSSLKYSIHRSFYTKDNSPKPPKSDNTIIGKSNKYLKNILEIEEKYTPESGDDLIIKKPAKVDQILHGKEPNEKSILMKFYDLGRQEALTKGKIWSKNVVGEGVTNPIWYNASKLTYLSVLAFFGLYLAHRLFGLNPLNLFGDEDESEGDDDDTPTIGTAAKLMKQAAGNDEPVERPDTKFDDVKGLGEVREQLEQVKDYIMNQSKYEKIGAGLPRGILLSGPPGVGKTLLGRAIAGECGVPFYFVASSTIDGMYVGTGAKRLTKLFKNARSHDEGAVIFFDELDAVGGKRTAGASINPYTRLTINKLLAEMDGFSTSDKVIVVASTNLPGVLDEALTRSGRFDQHIKIGRPTKEDRMEILRYYLDKVASDTSIDAEKWAKVLAGAVGADMEKIVNFAAFVSAKRCSDIVEDEDIKVGILRHYMGTEQRGRLEGIPEIDLQVNAYHQAGKAVCHHLIEAKGELNTITIIPRNGVSGKSIYKQLEYTDNMTRKDILNQVKITLGGPIAEQIITTEVFGAENQSEGKRADAYDYAKKTVRRVVKEFGMGVGDKQFMFHVHDGASEYLNRLCEEEIQRILDDVYRETKKMIVENKTLVKTLAEAVLEYETISGHEVKQVIERKRASAVAELRSENKKLLEERRLKMKENQFVDLEKK